MTAKQKTQNSSWLRAIPSVDKLASHTEAVPLVRLMGREAFIDSLREVLQSLRKRFQKNGVPEPEARRLLHEDNILSEVRRRAEKKLQSGFRRVINATGIILHTGLGRAVLPPAALEAIRHEQRGYSLLEVDAETGDRGIRETAVVELLTELTGAPAATVVNNNAGATLIALAALAPGKEVIVSRGQLVEIGGSFRIPEVMEAGGAKLVEVGTTNKTYLRDYEKKINPNTALLLRVHTSNFRIAGFTHTVPLPELVKLGRKRRIPVMDDLGSGCMIDLSPWGIMDEPTVRGSLREGASLVTFSGDKLLGGPQAGILLGKKDLIRTIRAHPLFRALRVDKLTLTALEATLKLYRNPERLMKEHPTMRMLSIGMKELEARAHRLADLLREVPSLQVTVVDETSEVGGGSVPALSLPGKAVAIAHAHRSADQLASHLRSGNPPIFARIKKDKILMDVRTLLEEDFSDIRNRLNQIESDSGSVR